MDENFVSNTIEKDDYPINPENSDYKNLIIVLKKISEKITLLEKKYINKF